MFYDEEEITARVGGTYSDIYSLKKNGELDESQDVIIKNDDEEVVWYDVLQMSHLHCTDSNGQLLYFVEVPSIEECKRRIDLYREQYPVED